MKKILLLVTLAIFPLANPHAQSTGASERGLPPLLSTVFTPVQDLRPRLARLRPGMSDGQVRQILQLGPFPLGFGCIHHWFYVYGLAPSNSLTLTLTPGTNGLRFKQAELRVPGLPEEKWPK